MAAVEGRPVEGGGICQTAAAEIGAMEVAGGGIRRAAHLIWGSGGVVDARPESVSCLSACYVLAQ